MTVSQKVDAILFGSPRLESLNTFEKLTVSCFTNVTIQNGRQT